MSSLLQQAFALHREGNLAGAEQLYRQVLAATPKDADALLNLSTLQQSRGETDAAMALLETLVAAHPRLAYGQFAFGNLLMKLGQHEDAFYRFRKAQNLDSKLTDAYVNAATVLNHLGRYAEAYAQEQKALTARPDDARLQNTRGLTLAGLKRYPEALTAYSRALDLMPDLVGAQWNKALLLLALGEYAEGWRLFECRWQTDFLNHLYRRIDAPLWLGEVSLAGKTLFVHHEQGFGDSIQYARYLPVLTAMGAKVILEVPPPLVALMEASFLSPDITIVSNMQALPPFDYHCPIMSLTLALGITLETMPNQVPYLIVPEDRLAAWKGRLETSSAKRIGLAWAGAAHHLNDKNRSISLETLAPLLQQPFAFHSIQKELRESDVPHLQGMQFHGEAIQDFADTAALIAQMDLVISVDTSVAHLAAALGKPVWLLLPEPADYRWMFDRDDSPLYPTARLFRQPAASDWPNVIRAVIEALNPLSE